MVSPSLRIVLCAIVGLVMGRVLGTLFVPDPTGTLALVLTVVLAAIIGGGIYRTDWLRNRDGSGS